MNNLFDVQRIEVLRGPQGTLFGKNTSAGAISVMPNTPLLGAFDASVKVGIGNFDNREVTGMINAPLGESAAARISGTWQQRDGYIEDVRSGRDSFNKDRQLVRGMLLWEPNDSLSWHSTVDYAKRTRTAARRPTASSAAPRSCRTASFPERSFRRAAPTSPSIRRTARSSRPRKNTASRAT